MILSKEEDKNDHHVALIAAACAKPRQARIRKKQKEIVSTPDHAT
jgi:hypothetical protein